MNSNFTELYIEKMKKKLKEIKSVDLDSYLDELVFEKGNVRDLIITLQSTSLGLHSKSYGMLLNFYGDLCVEFSEQLCIFVENIQNKDEYIKKNFQKEQ